MADIKAIASFAYMFGVLVCVFNLKVTAMNLHLGNAQFTQIQFIINESTTIMLNAQSIEFSDAHISISVIMLIIMLKLKHIA